VITHPGKGENIKNSEEYKRGFVYIWEFPLTLTLSPSLGERVRVRGLHGEQLNAVVFVGMLSERKGKCNHYPLKQGQGGRNLMFARREWDRRNRKPVS
jgi:hypothetical protein